MAENPMNEFKKTFTKSYDIQGKKFLFRSISTKESNDIEKEVAKQRISLGGEDDFEVRKIETLSTCLVSVDDIRLNQLEDIQASISKGITEKQAIKDMINELDSSFTSLLFLYYLDMLKQKDAKYEKETKYLNGSN